MNLKKKLNKKKLALIVSILVTAFFAVQFTRTYLLVRNLPQVENEEEFALSLINNASSEHETESMKLVCVLGSLSCKGDRVYYPSPLFPNKKLINKTIKSPVDSAICTKGKCTNTSKPGAYLYIDEFWGAFWVTVSTPHQRTKYYGPYKL